MDTQNLRIQKGITRSKPFQIQVDGQLLFAYPGETLGTVLLANGKRAFRHTMLSGGARGIYCGMGVCFECLVTVNGQANVRACVTLAQPGDRVKRQFK